MPAAATPAAIARSRRVSAAGVTCECLEVREFLSAVAYPWIASALSVTGPAPVMAASVLSVKGTYRGTIRDQGGVGRMTLSITSQTGSTWRGQLTVVSGGMSLSRSVVGSISSANQVRFNASISVGKWSFTGVYDRAHRSIKGSSLLAAGGFTVRGTFSIAR